MIRVLLCLLFFSTSIFCSFSQLNTTLESSVNYGTSLNDVWGYASAGKEYALVGLRTGVNIQDVTDPANPVDLGTATGPTSTWRDLKTFGGYAYITNENSGGLLIIDLTGLPTAITSSDYSYWAPNISGLGTLSSCHNIYIDGSGYGYLTGCNLNSGGILYIDLFTTPGSPTYVDKGPAIYSHDVYVENDIMYTSDIYAGKFTIYDVSNKANTQFQGDAGTPNSFTHNAWSNSLGTVLYTTDEKSNAYVTSYDISDPMDIVELDRFRPLASEGTGVIPHNVHVAGDFLVISHYSDGVIIVDASDPDNLVEVGNYDTYTGGSTGFNGAWGAFPFLPSGRILISDQGNGLFVVTPTYKYASKLKGNITDFTTGNPIVGASISINAPQANSAVTDFFGDYATGIEAAGTYDVTVSKAGYADVTYQMSISSGTSTPFNVALGAPLPIDLLSFSARELGKNGVQLNWEATQSSGPFEFELQRSSNGRQFETIATIIEESISGVNQQFSYDDLRPGKGSHYYRLKMIEQDRSFKYSQVENIDISEFSDIVLYPNPVSKENSQVYIQGEFNPTANYTINIISPIGEKKSYFIKGQDLSAIASDRFSTGLNYIEILENDVAIYQSQIMIH